MMSSHTFVRLRTTFLLFAVVITTACNSFGPDAVQTSAVGSMKDRNQRLWAISAHLPKAPIPCGHVHAAVIDEEAGRVLSDVGLQVTTATGKTSAVSTSNRYVTLIPRDSGIASIRVTRNKRVVTELEHWYTFRADDGYILTVVFTPVTQAVYVTSTGCLRESDRPGVTPPPR